MRKKILVIIAFTITVLVAIVYLRENQVNFSIPLGVLPLVSLSDILLFLLLVVDTLAIFVEYRERKLRKKYKHSVDLIKEFFEVGLSEFGHVDYSNDEITPFYVKWAESSPVFYSVVQHLHNRRYKKTWQAYENGKKYAESIINEIVKKIQQYREVVEQKLTEAEIQISPSEKFIDHQTKHYDQKFVKHAIFKDIQHILKHGKKYNDLRVNVSTSPNFSNLTWGASTFAVAEEDSLKSLKKFVEELEKDETLIAILREISLLEIRLKDNKELEQFNREREEIIRQVRYGQKNLKGKCNFCP